MVPVTQRRVGVPHGQCTEASIASILEVDLDDVPDLSDVTEVGDAARPGSRFQSLLEWLRLRHGRMWIEVSCPRARIASTVELRDLLWRPPGLEYLPWDSEHMIAGHNPAGVPHMIVGWNGHPLWDPNPTRAGLGTVDYYVFLPLIESVPEDARVIGPAVTFTVKERG